tara:strand:+ start:865 stop:1077 length:213 start_codon:yes stop_codon:yes gene_type:complete
MMKIGTLIKTTRARIGRPKGLIGLITGVYNRGNTYPMKEHIYEVKMIGGRRNGTTLRIFEQDFKVLNENR